MLAKKSNKSSCSLAGKAACRAGASAMLKRPPSSQVRGSRSIAPPRIRGRRPHGSHAVGLAKLGGWIVSGLVPCGVGVSGLDLREHVFAWHSSLCALSHPRVMGSAIGQFAASTLGPHRLELGDPSEVAPK